jgi:hypothetical protein
MAGLGPVLVLAGPSSEDARPDPPHRLSDQLDGREPLPYPCSDLHE